MPDIERWWRVHAPITGKTTWTDEDPLDRLHAAWENAEVQGPFILESESRRLGEAAAKDAFSQALGSDAR